MGTSSPSRGAGAATPLVPSWVDDPAPPAAGPLGPTQPAAPVPVPPPVAVPAQPEPPKDTTDRWRGSRSQFTRFARGGADSAAALGSALGSYIARALGG